MVAVEFREPEPLVEHASRSVRRFDLEAGASDALVRGPGCQTANHSASIAATLPARIRHHRFVADQPVLDRAIGECGDAALVRADRESGRIARQPMIRR
jgi:hypothetical protein